eukprot:3879709-Amphidinium_carterae.1
MQPDIADTLAYVGMSTQMMRIEGISARICRTFCHTCAWLPFRRGPGIVSLALPYVPRVTT